jgi:ATP-dependent helicase HrpA
MLLAARRHGTLRETLRLVAGLSIQDPRERPADRTDAADAAHAQGADARSDFLTLLAVWDRYQLERAARTRSALRRWCADRFLSAARMREWEELEAQLREAVAEFGWQPNDEPASPEALHRTLLTGLLGQIGSKTERGDFLGPRGRRFLIAPGTPLRNRAPRWIVAAQIVETQRVYARMVAAVEPAWIEAAAHHLLRREYTEPEWDEVRGVVSCRESVSLYGLVLAAGRRVNYGAVAPGPAREMFVREALVHGRTRLKARFAERNAALKVALRAEEAALRRHVVLVDESEEGAFYLARLPASVVSLAAFERWRRDAERADPAILEMRAADLRRPDLPPLDRELYPDGLMVAGNRLPLEYHFDPADPADGATLLVPEPLLPKLTAGELDWGVPGWRADKVAALIRGLPKVLRRRLVPAPDVARAALAELPTLAGRPFLDALAIVLTRLGGEPVAAEALGTVELEPYLRINVRVLAADGRRLAQGRELRDLQREQRRSGRDAATPAVAGDDPWDRGDVRRFDFGVLPDSVEVVRQGVRLTLHPALEDRGTHASLRLVADAVRAEATTRQGLVRLLALALLAPLKHAEKLLAADRELLLGHQPFGPGRDLLRAIAERALARECLPRGASLPRSLESFEAALERGRPGLVPAAERLGASLRTALAEARLAREELTRLPPGVDAEMAADLRSQLAGLLYEGFVAATPDPWLDSIGRYVKALRRRITKLPGAQGAVAAAQREYLAARHRYAALARRVAPDDVAPPALVELRWLVEEYAVQLFAQDLRTLVPVSAKRLAAAEATAAAAVR